MTETPRTPPYTMDDLVYLLGQCTVELAFLRRRIAQLEAQQAGETSPNGQVIEEPAPKSVALS